MKIKMFDVVELNKGNRATILEIKGNKYFAEVVNAYGITVDKRKQITKICMKRYIYLMEKINLVLKKHKGDVKMKKKQNGDDYESKTR